MLLNTEQAQAIHSAMLALSKVGGILKRAVLPSFAVEVIGDRCISVVLLSTGACENYADRAAFEAAYGLE